MSLNLSVVYDVIASIRLAEADRVGIIDHEWYKNYLKNYLESMGFKHFAETNTSAREKVHEIIESAAEKYKELLNKYDPIEKEPAPYNKEEQIDSLLNYLYYACELLNHKKDLKVKYTITRAYNCFMIYVHYKEKPPIYYLDRLKKMTDEEIKSIKNAGPRTFEVLSLARDLANRDQNEYTKELKKYDAGAKKEKEN